MAELLDALSAAAREQAEQKPFPEWLEPMLAKLTHDPFADDNWLYERKLDGERALAWIDDDGKVVLYSRNRKQLNDSYPQVAAALTARAPAGCIFDGELVAFDADGVSDFQRLQPRMQASNRPDAEASDVSVFYYLFDCLYAAGHDLCACPLTARKKLLKAALAWDDPLRWTPYRTADGLKYYEEACAKGWEGVIAKQKEGRYVHGRSAKWLKFKCIRRQEFVIGGYTEPQGEREGFGALLLGFYRDKALIYAGRVGTGFDEATLADLHQRLTKRRRKSSPFEHGEADAEGVHFVTPELVCEVEFTEWTADEHLRHPRFKGLRRDKEARKVQREADRRETEG